MEQLQIKKNYRQQHAVSKAHICNLGTDKRHQAQHREIDKSQFVTARQKCFGAKGIREYQNRRNCDHQKFHKNGNFRLGKKRFQKKCNRQYNKNNARAQINFNLSIYQKSCQKQRHSRYTNQNR
ncbi:MAG: hypothetical protein IJO67_06850 [Clostridia bacterium]|nr:hypothetical protein [Clostridia bacterium]